MYLQANKDRVSDCTNVDEVNVPLTECVDDLSKPQSQFLDIGHAVAVQVSAPIPDLREHCVDQMVSIRHHQARISSWATKSITAPCPVQVMNINDHDEYNLNSPGHEHCYLQFLCTYHQGRAVTGRSWNSIKKFKPSICAEATSQQSLVELDFCHTFSIHGIFVPYIARKSWQSLRKQRVY